MTPPSFDPPHRGQDPHPEHEAPQAAPLLRPTMRDVAERVGMSRQLVSIVLRGAPGASAESRERILAAARELGYHPDDSARMLRRRRSGQIGVLFTMRQPFEVDLVDALYRRAADHGYALALSTISPSRSQRTALDELMRQRIEALIALDTELGAAGDIGGDGTDLNAGGGDPLAGIPGGIPTILLGGPSTPEARDSVNVENETGIALAVRHLADLGHRRIAYIGPAHGPNAAERIGGYRAAMRSLALPEQIEPSDYTERGGFLAATELLWRDDAARAGGGGGGGSTGDTLPTALVCVNDHCAIGVLQTFVRAGVRVPESVSIIGFDDSTAAALPFVELTSVRPDPDRMAGLAIETVLARLADPSAPIMSRRVTPTLAVRGSTSAPRR